MKKPIFNDFERSLMKDNDSLISARLHLRMLELMFKRTFEKTFLFRFMQNTVIWLSKKIS